MRLARTRGLAFAEAQTNPHQRVPDQEFAAMVGAIARLPAGGSCWMWAEDRSQHG